MGVFHTETIMETDVYTNEQTKDSCQVLDIVEFVMSYMWSLTFIFYMGVFYWRCWVAKCIEWGGVKMTETEVVVQYHDGGGYYAGTDCNLYLTLVNSTLIL